MPMKHPHVRVFHRRATGMGVFDETDELSLHMVGMHGSVRLLIY